MRKENLYCPFEAEFKMLDNFPQMTKSNNFFELIFIMEGTGLQIINNNKFSYRKGNLFLITPQDAYSFEISSSTKFFFLKFNSHYLQNSASKDKELVSRMSYILENASHRAGCILKNKADKPLIALLVDSIMQERTNQQIYSETVIRQIVDTIITIVARNIALKLPKKAVEGTGETVLDILHYIQENIFEPQKLRAENIANNLHISLSYLGRYFKKQTGDTLQQYIATYKVRLVEMRLLHSDMRINEIVYEFGFSDESHLNKTFRKFKGLSPTEYKKQFKRES